MIFSVLISESASKFIQSLDTKTQERIKKALSGLKEDPFKRRSGADIKKIEGSHNPTFYRIRVGDYRAIYTVDINSVKITKIIHRERGYSWLD